MNNSIIFSMLATFFLLEFSALGNVLLEEKNQPQAVNIQPSEVVQWLGQTATVHPEGIVSIPLTLVTNRGFSVYRQKVQFQSPQGHVLQKVIYPSSKKITDPLTGEKAEVFEGGIFELLFQTTSSETPENFELAVTFLGCTSQICLFPYTQTLQLKVYKSDKAHPKAFAKPQEETTDIGIEESLAQKLGADQQLSLLMILLIAFLGGLLTNLTPCVYPMIPITIRLLAKQHNEPFLASLTYSAGILVMYTVLGSVAALTGGVFGQFMASPIVNGILSVVMAVLAFSMLGLMNFGGLQQLGNKIGLKEDGLKNAFLMGVGAGFIASPCTGPILAGLLTYTSTLNSVASSIVILFTYSFGFALPYVLLGTSAAKLNKRVAPPWLQQTTKIFFAAVMMTLALYYLRIPLYSQMKNLSHLWLAIFTSALLLSIVGVGFYVKNFKKTHNKKLKDLTVCFVLSLTLFSGYQSFNTAQTSTESSLHWYKSKEKAYEIAKKEGRPLFIDLWADWCEACKKMDRMTFNHPKVENFFRKGNWVLLKLDLTESNDENDQILEDYQVKGLPTLIIIRNPQEQSKIKRLPGFHSAQALIEKLNHTQ